MYLNSIPYILDALILKQGSFSYQTLDTLLNRKSSIGQHSVFLFKRIARYTDENRADAAAREGSRFVHFPIKEYSACVDKQLIIFERMQFLSFII